MSNSNDDKPSLTGLFSPHVQHSSAEPFISDVDIIDEKITIVNPSNAAKNMKGYMISDFHGKHVYHFPDDFEMPAVSKAVLFCCPGQRPHVDDYQVNHLLWMNKDGSLRKKEVLNNDGDCALLMNPNGVQIALCTHLGEMKLLGTPHHEYHGIAEGEHTGVIPFWRVLVLPLLLLFLMSYFFEAPPETFHTKLEDVVGRLRDTQGALSSAQARSALMESRYEGLLAEFKIMEAEVSSKLGQCSSGQSLTQSEVDALLSDFKEAQEAEHEVLRNEILNLTSQVLQSAGESTVSTDMQNSLNELQSEVESLHEETISMVKDFETMSSEAAEAGSLKRDLEDKMMKALEDMELELSEDVVNQVKVLPAPSLEQMREQVEAMIREVSTNEVEEKFAARVAEVKKECQQRASEEEMGLSLEDAEEALEKMIVEVLTSELHEHYEKTQLSVEQAVEAARAEAQSNCSTVPPSQPSRPDFAMRGAGGRVVFSQTTATYSPSEAEKRLRNTYDTAPGGLSVDEAKRGLRSTVSGLLTGAIGKVDDYLGGDVSNRMGLFETGVGGPNEAISQDLTLGSCWAMQGRSGHLTVMLDAPIHVTAITVDHVSRQEAIDISTAPAEFAVYGYESEDDETAQRLLLQGGYSIDSDQKSQTFELARATREKFRFIKLEIISNHGNVDYTCLYRFRVHGEA